MLLCLVIDHVNLTTFFAQGRIFHGRKTLCNLLDKNEVKKIPEPTTEEKFILQN